jgi:hypothetical protein
MTSTERVAPPGTGRYATNRPRGGAGGLPGFGEPIDWAKFGCLVPVVGADDAAPVAVVAAGLAECLHEAGYRVLLADAAPPERSALARARSGGDLPTGAGGEGVRVWHTRRGGLPVSCLEAPPGVVTVATAPPPPEAWLPAGNTAEEVAPEVTVVALGWPTPALTLEPGNGAAFWLRAGVPRSRPVLVAAASPTGLTAAERAREDLAPFAADGCLAGIEHLVLTGTDEFSGTLFHRAGERMRALAEHAIRIPVEDLMSPAELAAAPTPDGLRAALASIASGWTDPETPAGDGPEAGRHASTETSTAAPVSNDTRGLAHCREPAGATAPAHACPVTCTSGRAARRESRSGTLTTNAAPAAGSPAPVPGNQTSGELARPAGAGAFPVPDQLGNVVDFSWAGLLMPVLRAERGAGASLAAAVLADHFAEAGLRVLLVDGAAPQFSGLAGAASTTWSVPGRSSGGLRVRHARRGVVRMAALDSGGCPMAAPETLPTPEFWLPPPGDGEPGWAPQVTVVDVGWDPTMLATDPAAAPRLWLQAGSPASVPLLVASPSRPGLAAVERVCENLAAAEGGPLAPVARLVLSGADGWPGELASAARQRLGALAEQAVFLPYDAELAGGATEAPTPTRLQQALAELSPATAAPDETIEPRPAERTGPIRPIHDGHNRPPATGVPEDEAPEVTQPVARGHGVEQAGGPATTPPGDTARGAGAAGAPQAGNSGVAAAGNGTRSVPTLNKQPARQPPPEQAGQPAAQRTPPDPSPRRAAAFDGQQGHGGPGRAAGHGPNGGQHQPGTQTWPAPPSTKSPGATQPLSGTDRGATPRDTGSWQDAAAAQWDVESALAAGVAAAGVSRPTGDAGPLDAVAAVAGQATRDAAGRVAGAAATVRENTPALGGEPVDWSAFGRLVVLLGTGCSGTSVAAAALAEAAAATEYRVLLIDGADPATSGLAQVGPVGPAGPDFAQGIGVRHSRRGEIRLAALHVEAMVTSPGAAPPPAWWLPPDDAEHGESGWRPDVTIVDAGWDAARLAACPAIAAAQWLRAGEPMPTPLLVARPARPSLTQAEVICSRLAPWVAGGSIAPIGRLVMAGAKRWPKGVPGAAGTHLAGLLDDAVFLPHDDEIAAGGVTEAPMPARLCKAMNPLLAWPGGDPQETAFPAPGSTETSTAGESAVGYRPGVAW